MRALAVSADGRLAVSGSFDQSAILWAIDEGMALAVWRFHEGAVNAVAALPDGRFATGGEDGRIALWRPGAGAPERVIEGHKGPIVGLAVARDGSALASASWDGTARVAPLSGEASARVLSGHSATSTPSPSFRTAASSPLATTARCVSGPPGAIRRCIRSACRSTPSRPRRTARSSPQARTAASASRRRRRGARADFGGRTPVPALALSADGSRIAAATIGGAVTIIDRASAKPLFVLVGPGLPVWSLAFRPDGLELLTGGADRLVRRWDMRDGQHIGAVAMAKPEDFLSAFKGDRGAEVFQACAACHTLTPDGGNRAGPTLHGLFGRRIASLPGYNFSPALKGLDIVWSPETMEKLFDVGPNAYTPGTKMPEQRIGDAADREALVRFLEKATR